MYTYNENFIVIKYDDGQMACRTYGNAEINKLFYDTAEVIAFDDCSGEEVVAIVIDGDEIVYGGWMPGMRMQFINKRTGKVVFDDSFPQWDH